ncbi:MAG: sugar phosphate nucleotidyltransferase [Anaerolineales bacterium]|nr:sugar phosphate nucleotidyltransferase [Anaerolineales bacterium]
MTDERLKIVIPMAGLGTRLRPHTWSKPKQLVPVAGKAVISHVLDGFSSLPDPQNVDFIFIVGYLKEQLPAYMEKHYPDLTVHYVEQPEPRGQSEAIYLAREHLHGPMLMVFADTLVETDFSALASEEADSYTWVKTVEDPRRFGVAIVNEAGWVSSLIEKPDSMENRLAAVGFYYFDSAEDVVEAIEEQFRRDVHLKGEFFFVDAVNILLERGLKMRTQEVDVWFDAGTPEALLDTNRYLLDAGRDNSAEAARRDGVVVVPPVYIHPEAEVSASVVGPYASIGPGCRISSSVIRDSILDEGVRMEDAVVERSLIGSHARLNGRASIINAGDNSVAVL